MNINRQIEPSFPMRLNSHALLAPESFPLLPVDEPLSQLPEAFSLYWHVLLKRSSTILGIALSLAAIVAVFSYFMTPVYRATTRLEIEPETPLLQSQNDYQRVDADDGFIQTQIQILKGETLAWQTIQQLGLASKLIPSPQLLTKEEIEQHKLELIQAFQNHVYVELLPKTRMLSVSFESSDPQLSAQVANALANAYLDYNFRQKYDAIRRSGWMDQQVADLKNEVEKSQQALVTYERAHNIATTADKQTVEDQMLADVSRDLAASQSDLFQKQSLYQQVLANRGQMASLVHDDLLQKLEETLADLKQQYTQAKSQYGPNFPKAVRLQLEIDESQAQIEHEQNRMIDRIRNDYNAAHDRELLASAAVAHQKQEVETLHQALVQDNILQHEFETNQHLYQSMLERLKDATVSATLRSANIHLVDGALPPRLAIRPRKTFYTMSALSAGIILGIVVAFARDKLDSSIKNTEDAEALMVSPALGAIPIGRTSKFGQRRLAKKRNLDPFALTLLKKPNSPIAEAFRALATAVSLPPNPPKTLLITSSQNGEGKTVTALNLAQALSERKGPVLVMDCDLRKGGIARALGLPNDKGVSSVLSGEHQVSEALQPYDSRKNLWVLPSGPVSLYPSESLASQKMASLLEQMTARFVTVIIDSPPVLAVTDATILSLLADRVLLVAASGGTSRSGLVRARKILVNAGARILGLVVNKLDPRFQSYQNYGYRYYAGQNYSGPRAKAS
jgi:capsular exopolysaccharide synthesis family protein